MIINFSGFEDKVYFSKPNMKCPNGFYDFDSKTVENILFKRSPGYCYLIETEEHKTWDEAQRHCVETNSNLADFGDREEELNVAKEIHSSSNSKESKRVHFGLRNSGIDVHDKSLKIITLISKPKKCARSSNLNIQYSLNRNFFLYFILCFAENRTKMVYSGKLFKHT